MITCIPSGDPRTARTLRGCTIVIVALAALFAGCMIVAAIPAVNAVQVMP